MGTSIITRYSVGDEIWFIAPNGKSVMKRRVRSISAIINGEKTEIYYQVRGISLIPTMRILRILETRCFPTKKELLDNLKICNNIQHLSRPLS
jgi:hypothetical protein